MNILQQVQDRIKASSQEDWSIVSQSIISDLNDNSIRIGGILETTQDINEKMGALEELKNVTQAIDLFKGECRRRQMMKIKNQFRTALAASGISEDDCTVLPKGEFPSKFCCKYCFKMKTLFKCSRYFLNFT